MNELGHCVQVRAPRNARHEPCLLERPKGIRTRRFTDTQKRLEFWASRGLAYLDRVSDLHLFHSGASLVSRTFKHRINGDA